MFLFPFLMIFIISFAKITCYFLFTHQSELKAHGLFYCQCENQAPITANDSHKLNIDGSTYPYFLFNSSCSILNSRFKMQVPHKFSYDLCPRREKTAQHKLDYKVGDNLLEELQLFKNKRLGAKGKSRCFFQNCALLAMNRFCCTIISPYNSMSSCAKNLSRADIICFSTIKTCFEIFQSNYCFKKSNCICTFI